MIVICEDCGKKYRIDPSKIKKETAKFKCKVCNHIIAVSRPVTKPLEPAPAAQPIPPETAQDTVIGEYGEPEQQPSLSITPVKPSRLRSPFLSLRFRMFILFFLLPIVLFIAAGFLYLKEMDRLATSLTSESISIATKMAEKNLAQTARAVATQCQLYLLNNPGLKQTEFNKDPNFKRLAVRKVGMRGYTALYAKPGNDRKWHTWSHVDPKIIGIDMSKLKKPMGKYFGPFWKIYSGVKNGRESSGYYTWKDKDGVFREKFMVCTPVEGTPYVIAATAYVDELIAQIKNLKTQSEAYTASTKTTVLVILAGTVLLIGLIVSVFGHRLTGRIKALTEVTERISVGDLEADIPIRSKDEIGELGDAIARMQDSIRLSIERLRRRR